MGQISELHIQVQDELMQQINGNSNHIDILIDLRESRAKLQQSLDLIKSYEVDNSDLITNELQEYPEGYQETYTKTKTY